MLHLVYSLDSTKNQIRQPSRSLSKDDYSLARSERTEAQQEIHWSLLEVSCNPFLPDLASKTSTQSNSVALSESNAQGNKANHIHSVCRSTPGDLAMAIKKMPNKKQH